MNDPAARATGAGGFALDEGPVFLRATDHRAAPPEACFDQVATVIAHGISCTAYGSAIRGHTHRPWEGSLRVGGSLIQGDKGLGWGPCFDLVASGDVMCAIAGEAEDSERSCRAGFP